MSYKQYSKTNNDNHHTCSIVNSLEDMFEKLEIVYNTKNKDHTTKRMETKSTERNKTKVITEDTGKIFEKAICLRYGIDYVGPYKYGLDKPNKIIPLLQSLPELFPQCHHTAEKGSRYDFTADDGLRHLSAKTSKRRQAKVAPQVFGQCSLEKLCQEMNWDFSEDRMAFKEKFQSSIMRLLQLFEYHTFDCDIIYYNEFRNEITYIKKLSDINWEQFEFKWTKTWENWNNSTTLKIKIEEKYVPIFESQIHTKSRTNMANRWYFDNVLKYFPEHFNVIKLSADE